MHDAKPQRTLELIDRELEVERGILRFDQAGGRRPPPDRSATWRFIDHLLDERLVLMLPVVPAMPGAAPRAVDGGPAHAR